MKNIIVCALALFIGLDVLSQMAVNRNWKVITGEPDSVAWSSSKMLQGGAVITVGNTKNSNGDADFYIEKVDQGGNLVWSNTFDLGGGDDYGIDLTIDQSGDIYAIGSFWNSSNQNFDFGILKISQSGNIVWQNTYNSPHNLHDIPADISIVDGTTKLIVCGGSEGSSSDVDMLTVCLSMSSGAVQWVRRYNYANLQDAAVGVRVDQGGRILVVGASADSNGLFDNVAIKYDAAGNGLDSVRTTMGVGIDEPRAIQSDGQGNWYVTGLYVPQPQNSSIVVYKLDSLLNLIWSQTINPNSGLHQGNDLILDGQGNTYVTGFTTNSQGSTNCYTTKIDQTGNVQWESAYEIPNSNAKGLKLTFDVDGYVEVLGEVSDASGSDLLLIRYTPDGQLSFARKIHLNGDQRATSVLVDYANRIYVTGQTIGDTVDDFLTMQFTWSKNIVEPIVINDVPICANDELIIRFNPEHLSSEFTNDRNREFAQLNEILPDSVILLLNDEVGFDFGRQLAYKIFPDITPQDSQTISRQGHTVRQPKIWSALNVQIPLGQDFDAIQQDIETLTDIVYYTDLNLFGELHNAVPNDPHYPSAGNLHPVQTYPNGHINVEEAWELETGSSDVKVGVFDTGVEHDHEDFQFHGNSVVEEVWDGQTNSSMLSNPHADSGSHGTPVAAIIGAVRNNNLGNSGIAGGHDSTNIAFAKKGVGLYGFKVTSGGQWMAPVLTYLSNLMYTSSLDSGTTYSGLHLQNFSVSVPSGSEFYTDTNISLIREATRAVHRNGVGIYGARGNDGYDTTYRLPATIDDKWVVNVGGTGTNGWYQNNNPSACEDRSSFGKNLDLAAPATSCLIQNVPAAISITNSHYTGFGGTSGATPQVTGTAALLCSYLNDSSFTAAPEDLEWILQLSATDVNDTGYDDLTGYGRLNAGKALQLVENPEKHIEHHGTASTSGALSKTLYSNSVLTLTEGYENLDGQYFHEGNYFVEAYKISATVNHSIDTIDTAIANWTRNDRVTTMPLYNINQITPREECFITSFSETQTQLEGYVYLLKTMGGTPIGWIPRDTNLNEAVLEYSMLIHPKPAGNDTDTTITAAPSIQDLTFSIFPNPTNNNHAIHINGRITSSVDCAMYDVGGRMIKSFALAPRNIHEIALSDLDAGFYFYVFSVGDESKTLRFIKH